MTQQAEIMTLSQVAEYLLCHRITIYRLLWRGQIPAFQLRSNWRFRLEEVDRWIDGRQVAPVEVEARQRMGRRKK